jgi:hypothetical protein
MYCHVKLLHGIRDELDAAFHAFKFPRYPYEVPG